MEDPVGLLEQRVAQGQYFEQLVAVSPNIFSKVNLCPNPPPNILHLLTALSLLTVLIYCWFNRDKKDL